MIIETSWIWNYFISRHLSSASLSSHRWFPLIVVGCDRGGLVRN